MNPFYIVARRHRDSADEVTTISKNLASQKEAIDLAKFHVSPHIETYVFECVAKVEVPKPEPIVTMKGD
jgi:hypothetical protein